jgi:Putative DNA-binding domain
VIQRDFDDITKADIEALIDNAVAETRSIEYKQQPPGDSDEDKKEFLADISSFANAAGGDVIYGIVERRDAERKTTGVPESITGLTGANTDSLIRRLDEIIRYGIEPRVPGVRIRVVQGFNSGPVLLIRVPKSWASPHMVKFKGASRFFSRTSAGKYQLDVAEIRSAFMAFGDLRKRIIDFRLERLARITSNEGPVKLAGDPKIILHLVPFTIFDSTAQFDLQLLTNNPDLTRIRRDPYHRSRFNMDGYLNHEIPYKEPGPGHAYSWYTQVFRVGAIEAVSALGITTGTGHKLIKSDFAESIILDLLKRFSGTAKTIGVSLPIVVMVTMHGFNGFGIADFSPFHDPPVHLTIDRETLLLPDVLLEDYGTQMDRLIRPVFDAIWQSAGYPFCQNYDDKGKWDARIRGLTAQTLQ